MSGIRHGTRFGAVSQEATDRRPADEGLKLALGLKDPDAPIRLPISKVRRDGGTQPRAQLDTATIQEYAEDMARGDVFPPGVVFDDGTDYWLARGFTRTAAAELLGWTEFDYIKKQGTQRDAILFSVGENADHGLRRANADKRRAVLTLLEDAEWSNLPNREIARLCHVDEKTVRNFRNFPLTAEFPQLDENKGKKQPPKRMVQREGETYEMKTGKIGQSKRRRAQSKPSTPAPEPEHNLDESEPAGQWQDERPAQPRGLYRQAISPAGGMRAADDSVPTEHDEKRWVVDQLRKLAGMVGEFGELQSARTLIAEANTLAKKWRMG